MAIELQCRKVGMTQIFDDVGTCIPVTVLSAEPNVVVQVKTAEKEGYTAMQLGAGSKKPKQISGAMLGHFKSLQVPIKRELSEFRVSPDAILPVGTHISVRAEQGSTRQLDPPPRVESTLVVSTP